MMGRPSVIRLDGDVAYIELTRGDEAVIDAADVPVVEGYRWQTRKAPHTSYALAKAPPGSATTHTAMHRLLLDAPRGKVVDHKDGDGLNNRRENIRLCDPKDNAKNRIESKGKSGLRGVSWHTKGQCWYARIRYNGKSISLGLFAQKEDAHRAYIEASKRWHGEFAGVNSRTKQDWNISKT